MGDWSYLSMLLDKVQSHSTVVGKIWMSVLFLFRIFVLGAAADKVWGDEVSEFSCDTQEPGCEHACFSWMFPISYVHYWVLQIIFVATPTLVYLGYAVQIIHKEKRKMELQDGRGLKKHMYTDDRGKVKIKGILFCAYMTKLIFTILMEVGFVVGQFYIFGPEFKVSVFHCQSSPCSHISGAQCFNPRPTEKSVFIIFMLAVSGASVLLNIAEIFYLLCIRRKENRNRFLTQEHVPTSQLPKSAWRVMNTQFESVPLPMVPDQGLDGRHTDSTSKDKTN